MELGDRYLVVQRASVGAKGIASTPGMPSAEEYSQGMGVAVVPRPFIPATVDLSDQPAARILLMLNMVTPEDLTDDSEYEEILEDIRAECGNYGEVDGLVVPRPPKKDKTGWQPGSVNQDREAALAAANEGVGRVYVRYADAGGAANALKALAGRSFAGRSIIATLLGDEANHIFEQVVPASSAMDEE